MIYDGRSEDFATEMFVIINSTPTRINKSHLVDLYEKVSWAAPDKKFAAQVTEKLYAASNLGRPVDQGGVHHEPLAFLYSGYFRVATHLDWASKGNRPVMAVLRAYDGRLRR